jgi:hypothetical protein
MAHYEGAAFDNEYTIGETKAVLAPLVKQRAEDIKAYIVITIGEHESGSIIGVISNDEHPECGIGVLARVIELTASEIANA